MAPFLPPNQAGPRVRLNKVDAWRTGLLLLGVMVHAAGVYERAAGGAALAVVVFASRLFRMETYFVIAGFFAAFSFARQNARKFIKKRLIILGVPMITMLIVMRILGQLITPSNSLFGDGIDLNHLWFLLTLIVAHFVHAGALRK
jgi:hypothetical protein